MNKPNDLRDYQLASVEGLRAGHKRQILSMPTGSGKTETALQLIQEAVAKGSRGASVFDQVTLAQQVVGYLPSGSEPNLTGEKWITVNGQRHCWHGTRVYYRNVVKLAGMAGHPSVTWRDSASGQGGMLQPGNDVAEIADDSVRNRLGLVFNVAHTDNA